MAVTNKKILISRYLSEMNQPHIEDVIHEICSESEEGDCVENVWLDWTKKGLEKILECPEVYEGETIISTVGEHHIHRDKLKILAQNQSPSEDELKHIHNCPKCNAYWVAYREAERRTNSKPVPDYISSHIYVENKAVFFPNGEIALNSFQLGRLESLKEKDKEYFDGLIRTIASDLATRLRLDICKSKQETILLACFSNVVIQIAKCASQILAQLGYNSIEPIPVHDHEKLIFDAPRSTFNNSTVVCVGDISHSGSLLNRMAEHASRFSPNAYVHRLPIIQLVDEESESSEYVPSKGVYTAKKEKKLTPNQLKNNHPELYENLLLFEPELGRADVSCELEIHEKLAPEFRKRGVLQVDKKVDGVSYLYSLNILRLLDLNNIGNQNSRSQQLFPGFDEPPVGTTRQARVFNRFIEITACNHLYQTISARGNAPACLVYHEQRHDRAGRIASFLSHTLLRRRGIHVKPIGIGWKTGSIFDITKTQREALSEFHTFILVDAALRTGTTLTALHRAISDLSELSDISTSGFVIVSSKKKQCIWPADCNKNFHVKSVFQLPLPPSGANLLQNQVSPQLDSIARFSGEIELPQHLKQIIEAKKIKEIPFDCRDSDTSSESEVTQVDLQICPQFTSTQQQIHLAEKAFQNSNFDSWNKVRIANILMAHDNCEWLSNYNWVQANHKLLESSHVRAHWHIFPLALVWLYKRSLEHDCPKDFYERALKALYKSREYLLAELQPTLRQRSLFDKRPYSTSPRLNNLALILELVEALLPLLQAVQPLGNSNAEVGCSP